MSNAITHTHSLTQSTAHPFNTRHKPNEIYIKIIVKCNYNNRNGIIAKIATHKKSDENNNDNATTAPGQKSSFLWKKCKKQAKSEGLPWNRQICIRFTNRQHRKKWMNSKMHTVRAMRACVCLYWLYDRVSVSNVIFRRKDIELKKPQQLWQ